MRPRLPVDRLLRRGLGLAGALASLSVPVGGAVSRPATSATEADGSPRIVLSTRGAPKIFSEIVRNRPEELRALIAAGEDVNVPDPQGLTPVIAATYAGRMGLLEMLLNAGANPSLADRSGRTALYLAIRFGRTEAVRLLLAKGAATARIHANGMGALAYAAQTGQRSAVTLLMAAGADGLSAGPDGAAIHFAAARQDRALIEWLLARGEDIGRPAAATGMTPLMLAAAFGSPSAINLVLGYHPDANQQDRAGWTALMHAAHGDRVENAEALLAAGADYNAMGTAGETAYLVAGRRGQVGLLRRLESAGAAVTPIRLAVAPAANATWSPARRFARAMAALEQHANASDRALVGDASADARRNLATTAGVSEAEGLKRRLDELLRPESATEAAPAGPAVAELTETEFRARIAAVADDPVRVLALRDARRRRTPLGAHGLLAWRLCHHNYLALTAVAAGWLTAEEADERTAAAAQLLRAKYRSWAEVAPALVAGLGPKNGGSPRWEALTALFLNAGDPNSPWQMAPFEEPVR